MKGRNLAAILILGALLGSLLTMFALEWMDRSIFANQPNGSQPSQEASVGKEGGRVPAQAPGGSEEAGPGELTAEQRQKLETVYRLIQTKFYEEVDGDKLVDGAISGMLSSLEDPYSVYMDAQEAEQFNDSMIESTFSGIGAEVTMQDDRVTVVAPIKGSPAEKAGIRAKDVILSVNGESLDGLTLNEAVMKIRGPKGTQAKLEVLRAGSSQPIEIIVVRADIDVETVFAELMEDGIGKIEVRQIATNTAQRFQEELAALEERGMKALIIDMRNNPGGILQVITQMAEPFVPKGKTIVQVQDREGKRSKQVSEGTGKPYPVTVLVNGGSASAAEIFAAALQQSAGVKVIGEKTFGKGLVQSTYDSGTGDGSTIKLTIAGWLTPNGTSINESGVQPDITVEMPDYYHAVPLPKDRALKLDDLGPEVANLQLILKGVGYSPAREDGYFSRETAEALKAFQTDFNLTATGKLDEETAIKLEQELIERMLEPESDVQLQAAIQYLLETLR
ncbi:S41 family peptidase [Xylanibacillus composti]|nr:S41 family peptidase [Xylanibacillus composti]